MRRAGPDPARPEPADLPGGDREPRPGPGSRHGAAFRHAIAAGYLAGPYENLTLTKAGTDESDKFVHALKAWVAERLAPVGRDNPAAFDHALEHLARAALADEVPVLTPA